MPSSTKFKVWNVPQGVQVGPFPSIVLELQGGPWPAGSVHPQSRFGSAAGWSCTPFHSHVSCTSLPSLASCLHSLPTSRLWEPAYRLKAHLGGTSIYSSPLSGHLWPCSGPWKCTQAPTSSEAARHTPGPQSSHCLVPLAISPVARSLALSLSQPLQVPPFNSPTVPCAAGGCFTFYFKRTENILRKNGVWTETR